MNTLNKIRVAALALALTSVYASAATFSEADKNGDGALTLAEAKDAGLTDLVTNFKTIDTNNDGKLSKAELKANR